VYKSVYVWYVSVCIFVYTSICVICVSLYPCMWYVYECVCINLCMWYVCVCVCVCVCEFGKCMCVICRSLCISIYGVFMSVYV
jgi:hypothetical protein